jgi:acetoin utilization deacetylase AcuC-like enzyme
MAFTVYHPDTPPLPLPAGHRFPANKYALLRAALEREQIVPADALRPSPLASSDQLEIVHERAYVEAVLSGTLLPEVEARIGLPWSEILVARSLATVGGTLAAARSALHGQVSGQLAGGTHHAHRASGAGFCVFNDCAVAGLTLLDERLVQRIAVLDLDVHQGDGNAAILGPDPRAHVVSVHGANNYPFEKPPSDFDIGLADGTVDAEFLAACDVALAASLASRPDILFYIAGVDPLVSDRLGRLSVSADGLKRRDERVLLACRSAGLPVVVLIGGGYAEPIEETVAAYTATWRIAREVYG